MSNSKVVQLNGKHYTINLNKTIEKCPSGDVYYCVCNQTKQELAAKMIRKQIGKSNSCIYNSVVGEALMLKTLKHDNVVQVKEVIETSNNIYIFEQLWDSTLAQFMKTSKISEVQAIQIIEQIGKGYLFLLEQGVILQGVNPFSIVIKNKVPKIKIFDKLKSSKSQLGKDNYLSNADFYLPVQVGKYNILTEKQDIWSLGLILYEMLYKKLPFDAKTPNQFYQKLEQSPIPINTSKISEVTADFLAKTLTVKQKNRISWSEFFKHEIFQQQFKKSGFNEIYEDKLRFIMKRLKMIIQTNNLNLNRILISMGFSTPNQQIIFSDYFKFLQKLQPSITETEARYIFEKTDTNNSKSISVSEIETMFKKNGIIFTSEVKPIPMFKKMNPEEEHSEIISEEAQARVKSLFTKLYQLVKGSSQNFEKLFYSFAKEQKIDFKTFYGIISKVSGQISVQEAQQVFRLVDQDKSEMIDWIEFQSIYYRVNGLPPRIRIISPTAGKTF